MSKLKCSTKKFDYISKKSENEYYSPQEFASFAIRIAILCLSFMGYKHVVKRNG